MSTFSHSIIDKQTKNANTALKQYLKTYINYKQNNWANILLIAKFEVNSNQNNFSNIAPFLAIKKYYP